MATDPTLSRRRLVLLDVDPGTWVTVPNDTTEARWFSDASWASGGSQVFYSELVGLDFAAQYLRFAGD